MQLTCEALFSLLGGNIFYKKKEKKLLWTLNWEKMLKLPLHTGKVRSKIVSVMFKPF